MNLIVLFNTNYTNLHEFIKAKNHQIQIIFDGFFINRDSVLRTSLRGTKQSYQTVLSNSYKYTLFAARSNLKKQALLQP